MTTTISTADGEKVMEDKAYIEAAALLQILEISLKRGEVLRWLKNTSERLTNAAISESASSNMIHRLIKIIQEEFAAKKKIENSASSNLPAHAPSRLDSTELGIVDFTEEVPDLRSDILNAILDLSAELESSGENIAEDAEKHIHQQDVILTVGKSRTVEKFLVKAKAKKRRFEVIVATCGPFYTGREMAAQLKNRYKIPVTLMEDTGVFSVMSRVSKVIIGTHTILANGGLKAIAGCHPILLAAKHYNVPVLVLAPIYKLSPDYPSSNNVKIANRFVSPENLVKYEDLQVMNNAHVYATVFDYVPPELITLFIFNM
ncbi:Translation initiation factor eIF-2B subunit beta [Folsomia candida]|uniref:Translation initiation factor eIF2B subunit beta n=1 Tax=Folsomia candida TaxID=158441 RepID=A0A226ER12_FOLCA|nr:Translation initiation factor eIF-2B subunit beta [Folsomia candida]